MCQPTNVQPSPLSPETIRAERRRLRQLVQESGHSLTAQRAEIYDILLAANDHICTEHILDKIRQQHPAWHVNKTTVYRTLDLLQSLGLVYEMKREDGRAQYEIALRGPHGHLVCRRCGKLQDLDPALAASLQNALRVSSGFVVDMVGHALLGLCDHCASAPEPT